MRSSCLEGGGALADLAVEGVRRDSRDEAYAAVAGKSATARDHYNEATVALREAAGPRRRLEVVLRAYDDGVAFRYRFPKPDAGGVHHHVRGLDVHAAA